MSEGTWPRVAVMGAGAVGCYFGGMLARAGAPVTFIGRKHHVDAMNEKGLFIDSINFQENVAVKATTDPSTIRGSQIVLFCVKATDNEATAKSIAPHLDRDATLISLQNGPDNVPRIREASGLEALAAVVYVGAEMVSPGRVKHTARGELIIGPFPRFDPQSATASIDLQRIVRLFQQAKVPCVVSEIIELEIWKKLIINCALNAVSALGQARYLAIVSNPFMRDVIHQAVAETIAVAGAIGVDLSGRDWTEEIWRLAHATPHVISSTAQDIARDKLTEIDSFNGYIAQRGKELGISTPVNQTLHALVKLLESKNLGDGK